MKFGCHNWDMLSGVIELNGKDVKHITNRMFHLNPSRFWDLAK